MQELIRQKLFAAIQDILSCPANETFSKFSHDMIQWQGKGLRATLCLECGRSLGADIDALVRRAAVVEIFHLATLLHDDVLDEASHRRGKRVPHTSWGTVNVVLWGDYAVACALAELSSLDDRNADRYINESLREMIIKETEQQLRRSDWSMQLDEYIDIAMGKTGELFAIAAYLGAQAAGTDDDMRIAAGETGCIIGAAYQCIDDLYDLLPGSTDNDKNVWQDLPRGIMTLPTILALQKPAFSASETLTAISCEEWLAQLIQENVIEDIRDFVCGLTESADAQWAEISDTPLTLPGMIREKLDRIITRLIKDF
jgi:octaprenyl-diphosphate synthase